MVLRVIFRAETDAFTGQWYDFPHEWRLQLDGPRQDCDLEPWWTENECTRNQYYFGFTYRDVRDFSKDIPWMFENINMRAVALRPGPAVLVHGRGQVVFYTGARIATERVVDSRPWFPSRPFQDLK